MRDLNPDERLLVHQELQSYADAWRELKLLERQIIEETARTVFVQLSSLGLLLSSVSTVGLVAAA